MTKELRDLHRVDELKNFVANNFLKLVIKLCTGIHALISSSRTRSCALKMRDCHYRTSPIVYWGKGSTVGWYKVLDSLLVTVCCDNNGFSRVVTLKSLSWVFSLEVFPIHKQITVSTLFSATY